MRADYINPFIKSLNRVFQTMLGCEVRRGQPYLKVNSSSEHAISGVIGLSGRAVGTVVLSLSGEVAIRAASTMHSCELAKIDADVCDAIGELTNMVAGAAKAELEEYRLSVSLPNIVTGKDHEVRFPSNVTPLCVPFETAWGPLLLEVGLEEVCEPAADHGYTVPAGGE
jgi:chemotaxis protein CheX